MLELSVMGVEKTLILYTHATGRHLAKLLSDSQNLSPLDNPSASGAKPGFETEERRSSIFAAYPQRQPLLCNKRGCVYDEPEVFFACYNPMLPSDGCSSQRVVPVSDILPLVISMYSRGALLTSCDPMEFGVIMLVHPLCFARPSKLAMGPNHMAGFIRICRKPTLCLL
ncbi:hypothetical protein BDZ97DRAFT_187276 [Flammula alnicola]|nr:hypothetical protein BDZ97DRAFT_187276 [Flammula alnicola]